MNFDQIEQFLAGKKSAMIETRIPPFQSHIKTVARFKFRRLNNIKNLSKIYDTLPQQNESLHLLGVNKFDAWDVVQQTINLATKKNEKLLTLYINSWICNEQVVKSIIETVKATGAAFIFLTSSVTRSRDIAAYKYLQEQVNKIGKYKVINSHAKIYLIETESNKITIECSANLTGNHQIEQYAITNNAKLLTHYKTWYEETAARR